jgi:hypothetical protein
VGFGTGAIIGFASGDDDPDTWFAMTAEEKAGTGGVMLGIAGAGIGALCGLGYKANIDINYDKTRFQSNITLLKKYESSPQGSSKK